MRIRDICRNKSKSSNGDSPNKMRVSKGKVIVWICVLVTVPGGVALLLPFVLSPGIPSKVRTGFGWLRAIHLTQLEVQKGAFHEDNSSVGKGFWRQDIRGLEYKLVGGKPAGRIGRQIADSDIVAGVNALGRHPWITLSALDYLGEPPHDPNRYAVILWVNVPGREGKWTLISSQNGMWGKEGEIALPYFPKNPDAEGWLTEGQISDIVAKRIRLQKWLTFWGLY